MPVELVPYPNPGALADARRLDAERKAGRELLSENGFLRLLVSGYTQPVNLGNPVEISVLDLATKIIAMTGSSSGIVRAPLPQDDPRQRCPDITKAKELLDWEPTVPLDDGLGRTIDYFRETLSTSS